MEVWKKSGGIRGITLDGEVWCDVMHGRLINTPDGTVKDEEDHCSMLQSASQEMEATGAGSFPLGSGVARIFCGEVLFTNKWNLLILYRVGVS